MSQGTFVLAVGAIQERKNQLAALEAADDVGLPLVVVGPEKDPALAAELRRRGARLEGYVEPERLVELYRGAACLVQASRFEGFGLPLLEAMACGTPVVAVREPALEEVAGDAAVFVEDGRLADGIRQALAERDRLVKAGLERAQRFTWRGAAERTLAVYREILRRESVGGRRLARPCRGARAVAARARPAGGRDPRGGEHSGLASARCPTA